MFMLSKFFIQQFNSCDEEIIEYFGNYGTVRYDFNSMMCRLLPIGILAKYRSSTGLQGCRLRVNYCIEYNLKMAGDFKMSQNKTKTRIYHWAFRRW